MVEQESVVPSNVCEHRQRHLALMGCAAVLASLCALAQPQADPAAVAGIQNAERVDTDRLLRQVNSLGSVLFQLASESFAVNEKKQETWIMTLQGANSSFQVMKYSDGKTTVVALPVVNPNDEYGLRRYVDHYNRLNVKAADLNVKAGKYHKAKQVYRLLLHHDPHSSLAADIRQKLHYLGKLEAGDNVDQNLREFMRLFVDVAPGFLCGLEDARPLPVTNLFQIHVTQQ